MSRSRCDRFAEARSAFVDGSIEADSRDHLLAHLTHCPACRADVAELRRLRSMLNDPARTETTAPTSLQDRLVSIAAGQEQDPLWTRPFRRVEPKPLPSRRRRRRRRALVAATALGTVLVAAAGAGYLAAPPAAAAIGDPTAASRSDFAAALADQPLGSDPVAAALMAGDRLSPVTAASGNVDTGVPGATRTDGDGVIRAAVLTGKALSADEAAALVRKGERAAGRYSVDGVERIVVPNGASSMQAEVSVRTVAGQGSDFSVSDASGHDLVQGFVPATTSPSTDDATQLVGLLSTDYQLGGVSGVSLLGRSVSVLEARRTDASATPAARWWIDDSTGVLLGRQTYDASGALVQSSVLESMTTTSDGFIDHPAPRLTVPVASATMAPASGSRLSVRGWDCQQRLAGLPLTEVRTDAGSDPTLVHLMYSDGVWTVSVFERRGTLTQLPADARLDTSVGAYLSDGLPRMASWQSGEVTFTVVTDGPESALRAAVSGLPHAPVGEPTTMKRIAAGWTRIVSLTFG